VMCFVAPLRVTASRACSSFAVVVDYDAGSQRAEPLGDRLTDPSGGTRYKRTLFCSLIVVLPLRGAYFRRKGDAGRTPRQSPDSELE